MATRSPEEILAQREAWLARKTARESGEDVPIQPPLYPGEEPPEPAEAAPAAAEAEEAPQPAAEPEPAPAAEAEPAPEPVAEAPAAPKPETPKQRRTPEEIKAQREAFLAAKAAREAGLAAPPAAPEPVEEKPAPAAEKPAAAAPKPAPKPKPKAAAKPRAKKAPPPPEPIDPNVTRREFLNYAWLASIGLLTVGTVGATLWFAFPNFRAGEFGGQFPIGRAETVLPGVNDPPVVYTDGKFWLANVDMESPDGEPREGVLALYTVCTHLGCLYDWIDVTYRFECPCHGSKFTLAGDYLAGPARRSLDRFVIIAVAPDGSTKQTNPEGDPLKVDPADSLIVDTGQRILGSSDIVPA